MKKIIVLVSLLIIASCSKSDDQEVIKPSQPTLIDSSTFLPIKAVKDNSPENITTFFNYNGNKIVNTTSNNSESYSNWTYTGDLITKYEIGNPLTHRYTFLYNAENKLIREIVILVGFGYGEIIDYEYNQNGTISFIQYYGSETVQNIIKNKGKIYMLNGNTEKVEFNNILTNTISYTIYCVFDSKKNPFKNVEGYNKLPIHEEFYFSYNGNNLLSLTSVPAGLLNYQSGNLFYNSIDYLTRDSLTSIFY